MLPESMSLGGIIAIVVAIVIFGILSLGWVYRKLLDSNQKLQLKNKSSKRKRLDEERRHRSRR